jgi:hypothetical protein
MSAIHDPADFKMVWSNITFGGFVTGSHIEVAHRTPAATTVVGADGEGTFVVSHDKSGTIKVTIRRSHPMNRQLSLKLAEMRAGLRTAIGPLFVENVRNKSFAKATYAAVVSTPSLVASTDDVPIEWMLEAINVDIFHGGAGEFSGVS